MNDAVKQFAVFLKLQDDVLFTAKSTGEWSPSEHLAHLYSRVEILNKKLHQPKFLYNLSFERSKDHVGRTEEEIKAKYAAKVELLGGITSPMAPQGPGLAEKPSKLVAWMSQHNKLMKKCKALKAEELDQLLVKESPIGKISLREMLFFHIHDIYMHLNSLKES